MNCPKCDVEMFSVSSLTFSLGQSLKKTSGWKREMECPTCGKRIEVKK